MVPQFHIERASWATAVRPVAGGLCRRLGRELLRGPRRSRSRVGSSRRIAHVASRPVGRGAPRRRASVGARHPGSASPLRSDAPSHTTATRRSRSLFKAVYALSPLPCARCCVRAALSDSVSLSAARLTPLVLTPRNGQGAPKIKIESTRLAKLNAAYKHPVVHTLHQRTV